jgi:polyferredoxin
MDACDDIMDKINRPKGLIRYDSLNGILSGSKNLWTNRVKAYTLLLVLLLGITGFLLATRGNVEITVMRTPGMLFQETSDGYISNLYNYQMANKTNKPMTVRVITTTDGASIKMIGNNNILPQAGVSKGSFFVYLPKDMITGRKTKVNITILQGQEVVASTTTNFMGPIVIK